MRNATRSETATTSRPAIKSTRRPGNGHFDTSDDARAQQLLQAMLAFRDGDLSQRLPAGWTGVFGKIADAFNDVAALNDRRVHENRRVCQAVGKQGKLRQRMNVPGAAGAWADEVFQFNTLVEDLVWPTTEVARTIGAVAKGDLGQSMALEADGRPLEGEFLRSAKLVNKMIQLSVFTSEVTRGHAKWAPKASWVDKPR